MTPVHEQDPRVVLQDIIAEFDSYSAAWARREVSNVKHAEHDSEHVGKLRGLASALHEYLSAVFESAPSSDAGEVDHPGR
jgi:hypothetical protein